MPEFSIALAQINVTVGDIDGNVKKILAAYEKASADGAELVVFPELCVVGYTPEDLLLTADFRLAAMDAVRELAKHTVGKAAMIVGSVWEDKKIYNAALLLDGGDVVHMQPKSCLPNYAVFDEKRWFATGAPQTAAWRGRRLGILVCEDTWFPDTAKQHKAQGAELLISINASPFETGKSQARRAAVAESVKASGLPIVYVNLIGGQDDIVFDGGSFAMDVAGEVVMQMKQFEVDSGGLIVEGKKSSSSINHKLPTIDHQLWSAMKLGLIDYVEKNNFPGVLLGLSGGIDSAFSAAVAVDALGKDRVLGVLLPSPYTSKESTQDALELAKNLGIETMTVPITPAMETMEEVLNPVFHDAGWMENISLGGNLQARLRGLTLMAISNKTGFMLLSTGNKSEIAVGYTTLYGDSCGGYNVLKDVYKTHIYALAKWRNAQSAVIPERSIAKAPSAELAPGQKDQDQLPPYDILDRILELHIEQRHCASEIIAVGFDKAVVEKILKLVKLSEYKRRQSCPGVKLSTMLFGKDRRYPLTNKW